MLGSIGSIRSDDPYEQLIAQMVRLESRPQQQLKQQRSDQDRAKTVLSGLDSKLSALHTLLTDFTRETANPFAARSVRGGEAEAFRVTANAEAALGTHTLQVERLARADTRVSLRHDADGTDLRAFFDANGAQTFSIEVAHPTDEDAGNRVTIAVTVDPEGATDDAILGEIATAIDDAMSDAVAAGTITTAEQAGAELVRETSDTARLSLRSGRSGYANRLGFTDSASGLLAALEVTSSTVVGEGGAEAAGGMITDVGTGELDSQLNAVFDLNGLRHYRATNTITDALDGVTLTLEGTDDAAREFTVEADETSIKGEVENFIKAYNSLIGHLDQQTKIDPEKNTRGPLAGDSVLRGLRFALRTEAIKNVTAAGPEAPAHLRDLGIEMERDGTLRLADSDALLNAVEKDPAAVQTFFAGDDGLATRLFDRVDRFVGSNGILAERENVIDDRMRRLDARIAAWDDRLLRREDALRKQFAGFQETIAVLQGQQGLINTFFGFY
ncbi:MAG: flagellar filament capping protein FliD [Rhodothermales bacterium]|nr:flagellar filament capping protein FliD [Rhodothermales bacterium]